MHNMKSLMPKTSLRIPGVEDFIFHPRNRPYSGFGKMTKKGDTVSGDLLLWAGGGTMLLAIPKTAVDADTTLDIDIDGIGSFSYNLAEVLERGRFGADLGQRLVLMLENKKTLFDHPPHIDQSRAEFDVDIVSRYDAPFFQMRAITKSGKLFRSRPVSPVAPSAERESINVFSCAKGGAVAVSAPKNRIPRVAYAFTPDYGTAWMSQGEAFWNGVLGCGFRYLYPLRIGDLPAGVQKTAPAWVRDDDGWILRFNGEGQYAVLPPETMPHESFTLEFECRTDSDANQALFRHTSHFSGSLGTYIIDGKLKATFGGMGRNYNNPIHDLPVALDFPKGRWVNVKIAYNLREMIFSVDGKEAGIPFDLRANKPTCAIFGGFSSADKDIAGRDLRFFQGDLRSLSIRHAAK